MKLRNILPGAKKRQETVEESKKSVTEQVIIPSSRNDMPSTKENTSPQTGAYSNSNTNQPSSGRSNTTSRRTSSRQSTPRNSAATRTSSQQTVSRNAGSNRNTTTSKTANDTKDSASTAVISFHDHSDQRVAVFVDSSNLYHSAKALYRSRLNFEAVLRDSVRARKLIRAFAYVIRSEGGDEDKFFKALIDLGFETREKDLKIFHSGAKKADWDVGIAMDVVRMVPKVDVVVLLSGDGDFVECVRYAQAQGVLVEVVSFGKSTSAELIEVADFFLDLDKSVKKYTFLR